MRWAAEIATETLGRLAIVVGIAGVLYLARLARLAWGG